MQTQVVSRLCDYMEAIEESLGFDLTGLIQKVKALDPHQRFSPVVYSAYARLKDAYEARHVEGLFDELFILKQSSTEELYAPTCIYSSILTEHWERAFVAETRQVQVVDDEGNPLLEKPSLFPLIHWNDDDFPPIALKEAEKVIARLNKALWEEIECYTSRFKLYLGKVLESNTSPRCFGAIYLRLPPVTEKNPLFYYLKIIVHEAAHLHLFAMMAQDPLVLNEPTERFSSPLRIDKRPMIGIFHATFVLARMVHMVHLYDSEQGHSEEVAQSLDELEKCLFKGLKVIQEHARLTEQGHSIYKSLESFSLSLR